LTDIHLYVENIVVSKVPQGSIIGSILFLNYINDLDLGVENKIFADGTKIYGAVIDETGVKTLQSDLNLLTIDTLKIIKHRTNRDVRLHFFLERVISTWNLLDQTVVDAGSIDVFKKRLHIFRRNKMDGPIYGLASSMSQAGSGNTLLVRSYQVKRFKVWWDP